MDEITIKTPDKNILKELNSIGFDKSYIYNAEKKYSGTAYKVFNLMPHEANILKQLCLSLGFDCAVNRDTITCKCEKTDCIIFATYNQYEKLMQKLNNQPFRLKNLSKKLKETINNKKEHINIRKYVFDWQRPYLMGILNVTPDSFSDGNKYNNIDKAYAHCLKLINDGADIIDIGGESTRPDAVPVTPEKEIKRIIPVIKKIRTNNIDIPISVDTRNFETAKEAILAGADIINDVSGLEYDKRLFDFVIQNNIPTVIMHSNKVPAQSSDFTNGDVVEEIYFSLEKKVELLVKSGMNKKNIILDTGIGFGKSVQTNFELLKRMSEFSSLNLPLLLGLSRKSFITKTFNITTDEADIPTALYSILTENINIHRVHNVELTKKYLDYSINFK